MPREIPLSCIVDNTGDYSTKGIHRGRRRTITIMIDLRSDPGGDSWYQIRLFGGAIDGGDTVPAARLQLGQRDAYSAITDLQTEWRDRLIHRREEDSAGGYWFPFVDEWDLSVVHGQKERLAEIMPRLAREGHKLFALLFRTGDEELTALADVLVAALRAGPQVVTVHSDDLFVPWWLLYVPESDDVDLDADNAEWNWEGFWGYRHVVEHRTPWSPKWSPCLPVDPGERPVAGVNVDERLDEEFQKTPVIAPIVSMFQSRTTAVVRQS